MEQKFNIEVYNSEKIKEHDYLWKFVSIEKFFSIILNQKLFFTRLDYFEDNLEGIHPELLLLDHTKKALLDLPPMNLFKGFSIDILPSQSDNLIENLKETQKFNFANCWFLSSNNIESVAMWNLYSQPNSVALNIKYSDFYHKFTNDGYNSGIDLQNIIIGAIDYIDFQNPNEIEQLKNKIKHTPFIKDKSFSHENEFRIIAEIEKYETKPFKPKPNMSKYMQEEYYLKHSQIHSLDIFLTNFLEYKFEIVFHPKITKWIKNDIIKILDKFEIPFRTRDSKLKLK